MQKIRIDFDNTGLPQHISAVENDSQSRFFQATLYENGKAYSAPEGAAYSIMYRGFGPQNQGWYDTINDGAGKRAACAVSGNVVTCEIARQALQVPGHVSIVLCVTTGKGYMLKSWPIECDCKNDRYDSTVEIQSFFYITQVSNADWNRAIQALEELKNIIDPTLSVSGKAADAAKVGEAVNAESERAKGVESQIKEDIGDLVKSDRTEKIFWDMTDFSGWPSASNDIHVYTTPISRGNVIVSITLQPSSNYHNNGSVYLLSKQSDTQFVLIKKYENITTATLDLNYICQENTYIAISGEYNTNITQQSGFAALKILNKYYSVIDSANTLNYSLTSKVIILQKDKCSDVNTFFDVGEGCKYTNIQSAISDMPENSVIHVKNGIYRYGIDARTKNVTVIGESKENCIIEFANKTYGDSPVYIGIGVWKNLTFKVVEDKNASDYSRIKDLTPEQRAYAVHIDHFGGDREIIFANCDFYSELNRAVGIGLKKNVTLKFIRCNFESTADISPLGCHDCDYDYFGDNQILFLDSCNIHTKGCQYVFHTQDLGHTAQGNKMYYRFYRNIFWSDVNGKNDVIEITGASGDGWKGTSVVTLTGDSYGNNISEMNA